MRYLLEKSRIEELPARERYLFDVFGLHFIQHNTKNTDNLLELHSIPTTNTDILMIVAHDLTVHNYLLLHRNLILENTIILVTCKSKLIKKLHIRGKSIYFSHQSQHGITYHRYGGDYGFTFDITDSELDLYNSNTLTNKLKLMQCFDI